MCIYRKTAHQPRSYLWLQAPIADLGMGTLQIAVLINVLLLLNHLFLTVNATDLLLSGVNVHCGDPRCCR